ncbi:PAS domain-containing protein [Luteolibacter luteus]|uniref:histidine kinase n=1 Tax=Luteolibacter luteus TaxID=2728835 RepID=A0A858RE61_9BACT|nr:PAS domain-containing protein [Luteolibacter luteus]QJE95107.1 PAS domain-containing protein [Luteolibacter luteus]
MLRDPIEIQETACRLLGEYFGADRVGYAEVQEDGETVMITRSYTEGQPSLEGLYRLDDYGPDLLHAFREGRTVVRPDIANDRLLTDAEKRAHAILNLGATLNKPLLKHGELFGILFVHFFQAHEFTEEELILTEETAERTWAAAARARSEEALLLSEGRYRTLFESIDEGFCLIEVLFDEKDTPFDYRFLEANPAFERHTGLSNAVGRTVREMVPAHESHWFQIYGHIARTGIARRFEQTADALGRLYDVYAFRVGDPAAHQVAVLFNDVSTRKAAERKIQENEERLRTLFESMTEGFVIKEAVTDENGQITDFRFIECNPAFSRMTGLTDPAGCRVSELTPNAEPIWFESLTRVLASGDPVRFETRISRSECWWEVSVSRIGGPGSHRVAIVLMDVTARKSSEAALAKAREELEIRVAERTSDLQKAMTRLQSEAAERERLERDRHDLLRRQVRTQEEERKRISRELHDNLGQYLTAVMLRVQLLRKSFESGDSIDSITSTIEDLKTVVDSLMKASHRQAWELRPAELDHFGLEPALRAYVTDWSERTGIATTFDSSHWHEVRLHADCEIALYRVVQEALTNVARHAVAEEVTVTLKSNGDIEVQVKDDGKGFDPEIPTKRLGLLGMKERISLVEGCLTIDSAPGSGTVVSAKVSRPTCSSS